MTKYRATDKPYSPFASAEEFKAAISSWEIKPREHDEEYPFNILIKIRGVDKTKEPDRRDVEAGCRRFLRSISAGWSGMGIQLGKGTTTILAVAVNNQQLEDTVQKLREAIGEPAHGWAASGREQGEDIQER